MRAAVEKYPTMLFLKTRVVVVAAGRLVLRQLLVTLCLLTVATPLWANTHLLPIRIGIPHKTLALDYFLIDDFRQYLESRLNHPVEAVVHGRFNNSTTELYRSKLDFAWVTDYPDNQFQDQVRLVAVPLYSGRPFSSSYLIVSAHNTQTKSLMQLKGAVFAFADRQPNGSYLDIRYQLLMAGENPERFFGKVFFTKSHKDVIKAVALGLAHAGAVDSVIWDAMVKQDPHLTALTRAIARSAEYGAPAFLANRQVSPQDFDALQRLLLTMDQDEQGKALLARMRVDKFVTGDEHVIYQRQYEMRRALGEQ